MPWSQLTKVKNFTVILLYINLRVNIGKDDNIFKIIHLKRYIHIGNQVFMWKFNSKRLMFMKVSNSAIFLRLFLLKILSLGLGTELSRTLQLSPGFSPSDHSNNRERSSVHSGHLTLQFSPLSVRKSYLMETAKSQPDVSQGQISDKIHYYTVTPQYSCNQFQFVPKYSKPVDTQGLYVKQSKSIYVMPILL